MSTFQGQCGYCDPSGCWSAPVFPGQTEQFGGSDSKEFRATATVYGHALLTQQKRFASATDYMRYKKGLIAAGSAGGYRPYRAPPAPIADMIAAGCPTACESVCPVSTIPPVPDGFSLIFLNSNTPFIGFFDLGGEDNGPPLSFVEFILSEIYGPTTITIPDGYPYDIAIFLAFPPYCNATSNTVTLTVSGDVVPFQSVQYGPSTSPDSIYGSQGIGGIYVIFPGVDLTLYDIDTISVSLTVSNSCSSESGEASTDYYCFLAGSPVALADGTTKPIETVNVGDRVIGAFGEINTVTGTLSNRLGFVPITNINGEHKTTAPHPHITVDHKLSCTDTFTLTKLAYGRSFPLKGADGTIESRVIKGVSRERITKLEVGTVLQTQTGARTVATLETIRMPPSTRVYHLTTDGSHSYLVDGYAVAGGATEEDFDYDTWTPRS